MPGLTNRAPRFIFTLSLLIQLIIAAHAQSLQGTWQGILKGPTGSLPLIFDLNADGSGTLKSPVQNLQEPVNYTSSGNTVIIKISAINASYRGSLNGAQLSGTWSQMLVRLPLRLDKLNATPAAVAVPASPRISQSPQPPVDSGVTGHWIGRLVGSGYDWPLHLWLNAGGSGNVSSSTGGFDAVAGYTLSGNQLTLSIPKIHASIQAAMAPESISGTWLQNGASIPINMTRQHLLCPPASPSLSWPEADCKASIEAAKGAWNGVLLQSTGATRFKLDLREDGSGYFSSAATNDQAKLGYYFLGPNQISIAIPSINAKIDGSISSGKFAISDLDLGSLQTDSGNIQCNITRGDAAGADSQPMPELQKLQAAMSGKTSPSDNPTLLGNWQGKATTEGTDSAFIFQFKGFGYGYGNSGLSIAGTFPVSGTFQYKFNGNQVSVLFLQSNATFEGIFDTHQMKGTISFFGKNFPLTLTKP